MPMLPPVPVSIAVVGNPTSEIPYNGPAPTAVSEADRPAAARAKAALASLATGDFDASLLTPSFRTEFTRAVAAADASFLRGRGEPKRFLFLQRNDLGDSIRYVFIAAWADGGSLSYTLGIDKKTDLIDALYFRPAANPL